MTPDEWRAWQRVLRDFVLVAVGAFMLIHETLIHSPNPYLIGGGLTALGLPPALRLDEYIGSKKGTGKK